MQTGEYDRAWNTQVEDEILQRLEKGGKGRVEITQGGNIEHIRLNSTDPWTEVEGERSSIKTKHPLLSDPAVRKALGILVDRKSVEDHIYGGAGIATGNFLNSPERFRSENTKWEFNIEKASQLLEDAGWKKGSDDIRAKDGKKLKLVYQITYQRTATEEPSDRQAGLPEGWHRDRAKVSGRIDVLLLRCRQNKWQGRNITRWQNTEYDKTYRSAEGDLDPVKRAALFIRLNDLVCGHQAIIPVVYRPAIAAISHKLHRSSSGWDDDLWDLLSWYRAV